MANYVGRARSNYFAVNDLEAFKAYCTRYGLEFIQKDDDPALVGFIGADEDPLPSQYIDENDEEVENGVLDALSEHLAPGHVAVVMEVGNEQMRYLIGRAWAVSSDGRCKGIDLTGAILKAAHQLGEHVTEPSY